MIATFLLGERPGPGTCGPGSGTKARTVVPDRGRQDRRLAAGPARRWRWRHTASFRRRLETRPAGESDSGQFEPFDGSGYVYSDRADVSYKRLSRTIDLSGVSAADAPTLTFRTSYGNRINGGPGPAGRRQ